MKKTILLNKMVIAFTILLLCTLLVACSTNNPSDLEVAEEYYASGDYTSALQLYEKLGEYDKAKLCKYQIANLHFESANYKSAMDLYIELGNYEDSQNKVSICQKEIGMNENSDYDFLSAIEASVLYRIEKANTDTPSELVTTELAYVDDFAEKSFYDPTLKMLAKSYIQGLYLQAGALNEDKYYKVQIQWLEGEIMCIKALDSLYKEYQLLSDNNEFIETLKKYDEKLYTLNGYYAIEDDISQQTNNIGFRRNSDKKYCYCKLTNNTTYTFGTHFEMKFYDGNRLLETQTVYIDNITPGMTYTVKIYFESYSGSIDEVVWQNYYEYVE